MDINIKTQDNIIISISTFENNEKKYYSIYDKSLVDNKPLLNFYMQAMYNYRIGNEGENENKDCSQCKCGKHD